jgi:hypothetical protein
MCGVQTAAGGNSELTALLVRAGANVDTGNSDGNLPAHVVQL